MKGGQRHRERYHTTSRVSTTAAPVIYSLYGQSVSAAACVRGRALHNEGALGRQGAMALSAGNVSARRAVVRAAPQTPNTARGACRSIGAETPSYTKRDQPNLSLR